MYQFVIKSHNLNNVEKCHLNPYGYRPTMVTLTGGPMEKRRRQELQHQQQQTVMQPRPLFPEMERGFQGNGAHPHPFVHQQQPQPQQQVFQGMTMAEREDKIEMLTRENAMLKV